MEQNQQNSSQDVIRKKINMDIDFDLKEYEIKNLTRLDYSKIIYQMIDKKDHIINKLVNRKTTNSEKIELYDEDIKALIVDVFGYDDKVHDRIDDAYIKMKKLSYLSNRIDMELFYALFGDNFKSLSTVIKKERLYAFFKRLPLLDTPDYLYERLEEEDETDEEDISEEFDDEVAEEIRIDNQFGRKDLPNLLYECVTKDDFRRKFLRGDISEFNYRR